MRLLPQLRHETVHQTVPEMRLGVKNLYGHTKADKDEKTSHEPIEDATDGERHHIGAEAQWYLYHTVKHHGFGKLIAILILGIRQVDEQAERTGEGDADARAR